MKKCSASEKSLKPLNVKRKRKFAMCAIVTNIASRKTDIKPRIQSSGRKKSENRSGKRVQAWINQFGGHNFSIGIENGLCASFTPAIE